MHNLTHKYEEEKHKLNELGQWSLEQGIPLSINEALQVQNCKVDELINQLYQEKNGYSHALRLNFCRGGDMVSFPAWFIETIQGRLVEVSAQIERQSEPRQAFEEERNAFQTLFASMDIAHKPEFEDWEDKLSLKHSVIYERLYLQGLKDGMQLANTFAAPSVLSD